MSYLIRSTSLPSEDPLKVVRKMLKNCYVNIAMKVISHFCICKSTSWMFLPRHLPMEPLAAFLARDSQLGRGSARHPAAVGFWGM